MTVKYTSFYSTYEIFAKIDHIVGHKTHLEKFKRIAIIKTIRL